MHIKQKGEDMKIIDKIIDFVKSIFIHPELLVEGQETKVSEQKINNFMESLQKDTQNYLYKNEILDEIERNPELIDKLSYERLVKLNQLYDEKITELERLSLNVDINKK